MSHSSIEACPRRGRRSRLVRRRSGICRDARIVSRREAAGVEGQDAAVRVERALPLPQPRRQAHRGTAVGVSRRAVPARYARRSSRRPCAACPPLNGDVDAFPCELGAARMGRVRRPLLNDERVAHVQRPSGEAEVGPVRRSAQCARARRHPRQARRRCGSGRPCRAVEGDDPLEVVSVPCLVVGVYHVLERRRCALCACEQVRPPLLALAGRSGSS